MKQLLFCILMLCAASAEAQWKNAGFSPYPIIAFGVHDSSLFLSIPGHLYGYNVNASDAGIGFSAGNIVSFTSLGRYFYANQQGVDQFTYQTTNNGSSWQETTGAVGIGSNGSSLFGNYEHFGIRYLGLSRDSGHTWDSVANFVAKSFSAIGKYIYANTGPTLWRSTDTGNNWSKLSQPFSGNVMLNLYTMDSVLILVDNDPSLIPNAANMMAVSYDLGQTWIRRSLNVGTGIPDYINTIVSTDHIIFAGSQTSGVFLSRDSGVTWKGINDSLPVSFDPLHVTTMGIFDTLLFADLTANGEYNLFVRSIPEILADTGPASVVQNISPSDSIEIYPNPATGFVTIFSGSTSIYGVRVLNVLGESALAQPLPKGVEHITVDLSKLPSGTYFIDIRTSNGSQLRKISIER